jgi:2-hydroxychromene-2-carboxylate isomerase
VKLTVCIDVASLPSYVALPSILAMRDEFRLEIEWQPLTGGLSRLSARRPDEDSDDPLAQYKARRQKARDTWAARELQWECDRLGITTELGGRRIDSSIGALGTLYVAQSGGDVAAYLERAFAHVFRDGASLEESDVHALIGDDGFHSFASGDGNAQLDALQAELLEGGIYASPAFVLEGEIFQGRQHFPLIRWQLSGRIGSPPV